MKTIVITSPGWIEDEATICNSLFAHGLELLHLRKPGADRETYEEFICRIAPRYRKRLVLHEHYDLVQLYQLHGIHLKSHQADRYSGYADFPVSISCHSLAEIKALPFRPVYCFLSPIFDSISKQGYTGTFPELPDLSDIPVPVIALGGLTPDKVDGCRQAGFSGVAALGYIWEKPEEALSRFIRLRTPFVMSIAGFDPSSGAGVTADIKTFEATGSYGLSICSALTFQNETTYTGTHWISLEEIRRQCELQLVNHQPGYIKIGLIENFEVLDRLTGFLHQTCPGVRIVWDPILKATAGQVFHENPDIQWKTILERIYLITPNTEEVHRLFGKNCRLTHLQEIAREYQTNILWKGGHNEGPFSSDYLITPDGTEKFTVQKGVYDKHGTGCVLSAAITSRLAQGYPLAEACSKAQLYVSGLIHSNDSRLGFHLSGKTQEITKPHPLELNLQYITAPKAGVSLCEQVEAVCRGGMRWVQLRMKDTPVAEFLHTGRLIREICHRYQALFIVNDRVDIARELDADGVHLGKEDMDPREARSILGDGKIIGATCNTWEDILLRREQQVDYIGLGPFTFTTTKEKLSPVLGLEGYHHLLSLMQQHHIGIPVFAIGGITETDILPLMKTGIQGIALSGLIKNSNDLSAKTAGIIALLNHKSSPQTITL